MKRSFNPSRLTDPTTGTVANVAFASTGVLLLLAILGNSQAFAGTIESFVEPYRRVAIPAAEIGVLADVVVVEGDQVSAGQLVAKLDDSVLQSSADLARAAMNSKGALLAAETENQARQEQLESYRTLRDQGNASPREYERAVNEQAKAAARLQSVHEEQELRRLEFARVEAQIEQRKIKSPIKGHVVAIDKTAGEFVSPTDPVVMHVVQLDTLKAVFSVPRHAVLDIAVGQKVELNVGFEAITCVATVDHVSPIADPKSGTVRVKLRIANQDRRLQSGSVCRWDLVNYEVEQRISVSPTAIQR